MTLESLKTALTASTLGFLTLMSSNFLLSKAGYNDLSGKWYVSALIGSVGLTAGSYGKYYLDSSSSGGTCPDNGGSSD